MKMLIIYLITTILLTQVVTAVNWNFTSTNSISTLNNEIATLKFYPDTITNHNQYVFLEAKSKEFAGNGQALIGISKNVIIKSIEKEIWTNTTQVYCGNMTSCQNISIMKNTWINENITLTKLTLENMTEWYTGDTTYFNINLTYKYRFRLENFSGKEGKYWAGIKPTALSITNAKLSERLMAIDPIYYGLNYTKDYIAVDSFENAGTTCGQNTSIWTYTKSGVDLAKNTGGVFFLGNQSCQCAVSCGSFIEPSLSSITTGTNITCSIYYYITSDYATTGSSGSRAEASAFAFIGYKPNTNPSYYTYGPYTGFLNSSYLVTKDKWQRMSLYAQGNGTWKYYINNTLIATQGGLSNNMANFLTGHLSGTPSAGSVLFDDFRCWYGNYTDEPQINTSSPAGTTGIYQKGNAYNWTFTSTNNIAVKCGKAYNWTWTTTCSDSVIGNNALNWTWKAYT